ELGLDWPLIAREADAHGVSPLLYRSLAALVPGTNPDDVLAALKTAYQVNVARSRLFVRTLVEILQRFSTNGIPAMPLKGVALAESLYGDVGMRVCVDLDVLVPRGAVGEAVRIIGETGYKSAEGEAPAEADLDWLLWSNVAHAFVRDRSPLIELHWDLVWRWRGDTLATDEVWREAERTTWWEADGYRLSPEWELIYLAVHAAPHRWGQLKWLVDI